MYKLRRRESMFSKNMAVCIFACFFLLGLVLVSPIASSAGVQPLVDAKWLSENLKKPGIVVVYVAAPAPVPPQSRVPVTAPDDKKNFDSKHIPNAVYLDLPVLMDAVGDGSANPDKAKFQTLMGKLGISNDSHVVLYGGSGWNPFVSTAFWLMDFHGHEKLSILNGGMSKWTGETTSEPTKIKSTTYKVTSSNASAFSDANYVLSNHKNPKVAVVDTRGAGEFNGTVPFYNKRTGHIPDAINIDFAANLNPDGTFKSANDLKAVYEPKGITKDKEAITYCQSGVRASVTYFAIKHVLGYPKVRNYAGSIDEWANRLDAAKYPLTK